MDTHADPLHGTITTDVKKKREGPAAQVAGFSLITGRTIT